MTIAVDAGPHLVVPATALACAAAAAALTPWMRGIADSDSRWLGSGVPVVFAALAGAGAAVLARHPVELAAFAVLAVACALLVVVDLAVHRLPDVLVGPMYAVLLVGLIASAASLDAWADAGRALAAAVVLAGGYLVLALASPSGLGAGDIKLAGVLGGFLGWLGWPAVVLGTAAAFALGAATALVLVVAGRATGGTHLAFGPPMILGAACAAAVTYLTA